jgi:tetratricopeptide (TPR) repeat protein
MAASLAGQEKSLDDYKSRIKALQSESKYEDASGVAREAVSQFPGSSDAHLTLGLALGEQVQHSQDMTLAMKLIQEAFTEMEKAVELDENNLMAHFYLGAYGVNVPPMFGKLETGVDHLEKSLEMAKADKTKEGKELLSGIYFNLGKGYAQQGRFQDSRDAYTAAAELDPEGKTAEMVKQELETLKKTEALKKQKMAQEKRESAVVVELRGKVKSAPRDLNLWIELGKAYFKEEQWEKARKAFEKAVKLDTTHAKAQLWLARAYLKDSEIPYNERAYEDQSYRTALAMGVAEHYERAVKLNPDDAEARLIMGVIAIQMPFFVQRMDEGLKLLEAMAGDESLPESMRDDAMYHLGYGYRKKGTAIWMKLLKEYPKSDMAEAVYDEFGLRRWKAEKADQPGEKVLVTFHMGFMDELAPQTGVWVEDANGKHIKTLYVSGFSGYAQEKQVVLPAFAKATGFETDGTTGASIDWGTHTYVWDVTDHEGKRVADGEYTVHVEISWWPSMKYGLASAPVQIGGDAAVTTGEKPPFVPLYKVKYMKE